MTENQKQRRVWVCEELLEMENNNKDFMKTIITRDKAWMYGYDIETKTQSLQ